MLIQTFSKDNAMKHDNPIVPTNPQKQRRKTSGFSLIELLIAMALLLILAALAVPNYLAAMARANEASAASSVRAIISAENLYRNTFGTFTDMPNLGVDYLTDNLLSGGAKERIHVRCNAQEQALRPVWIFRFKQPRNSP